MTGLSKMSKSDFFINRRFAYQFSSSVPFANPEVEIWELDSDGILFVNSSIPTDRNTRVYGYHMGFHAVEADFCGT